jgi:5-methylcytosine-specific restriction endonuclease McrA
MVEGGKMPIQRTCLECGASFSVPPSQVRRGGGKFCSIGCGTRYRNKTDNPAWRPEVREKISKNHADVSGKNNPMYGMRGFLAPSFIDGRNSFKGETYRRIALANLPHKCALCGETDLRRLDVHHKDGNRKNNSIDNLVFLCKKCHITKAHKYHRNERGIFIGAELNKEVVL